MKIDGFRLLNQLDISTKNQILSKLSIGDTIRVQVAEQTSQTLVLRLPDGSFINASSMLELDVHLGDFLDLSVNQKTDSQIFVEIVKENVDSNIKGDELKLKLQAIDIPVDSKSIEIAQEMIKNNISLTKENFQKINQFIKEHHQITPEKATFMTASDIPVNDKNIAQLEQFIQHKQLVGEQLKQLTELLDTIIKHENLSNTGKQMDAPKVVHDRSEDIQQPNTTQQTNTTQQPDQGQKIENEKQTNSSMQIDNNQETLSQLKNISLKLNGQDIHLIEQQEDEQLLLKDKKVPNEQNILKETKGLITLVKSLFKVIDNTRTNSIPQEIQEDKLLKELTKTFDTIKGEIENINSDEKQSIISTIQDIEDSLRFMDQLNKFTSFIQIPININGQDTTAELYVLKDGNKKKKIDPSNATIFLSLFTINLGRIETLVNIRGKSIECTFRSEDKDILTFIKKNSMPLYHLLDAQGYKLTNVMVQEITESEHANITNVKQIKRQVDKKYSFDTRV